MFIKCPVDESAKIKRLNAAFACLYTFTLIVELFSQKHIFHRVILENYPWIDVTTKWMAVCNLVVNCNNNCTKCSHNFIYDL